MSNTYASSRNRPAFSAFGAGMGDDARRAMNAAFDAMANWRNEIASITDRNSDAVYDKMAAAAKSVGWPAEFVDMTRQNMQNASKMQMQIMDQVMDAWEQQMKNPGAAFANPATMMEQMKSFPGFGNGVHIPSMGNFPSFPGFPSIPGMPDMGNMPMVPLQFWMQAAEMWQKSWQQALSTWMEAQANMMGKGGSR